MKMWSQDVSSTKCHGQPLEGLGCSIKVASLFGKSWVVSLLEATNRRGLESQKLVVESSLGERTLQHVMP